MTDRSILAAVFDNISEGVSMVDQNLITVAFNDRFLELLDFPPDLFRVGDPLEKFLRFNAERGEYGPGDIDRLVREKIEQAKKFEPHDIIRRRPNGTAINIRRKPIPGGGFVATLSDITNHERALNFAEESESQYRRILDTALEGIISIDQSQRIRLFNRAAETIFGYTAEEVLGQPIEMLLPERFRYSHAENVSEFSKSSLDNRLMNERGKIVGLRKSGAEFPAAASVSKLQTKNGLVFTVMLRDITELAQIDKDLQESKSRFQDFAESASDWFWETDANGHFVFATAPFYQATGLRPKDLIGKHRREIYEQYYKYVTSPGVGNLDTHLNAVDRQHEFRDLQIEYLRPDGSKLYFKTSGRPHFGENGEFLGYRGAAVDITQSKIAEFELEKTTFQLLEAQRIAQIGSWTFDFPQSQFSWSEQVFRIFEVDLGRDDLLEKAFLDTVYPDDPTKIKHTDAKSLINQEEYEATHRLLLPGSRTKWVQARGETSFDKDGQPLVSWGTVQDVTEIKRFEDDLTQALSVANQANRAKSDFLATMSHELRTPLNAIIGFSEILNQQLLGPIEEEKYLEYAQDIEQSGRYLLELIDDILDMSKIEAKEYRLTKSEISVRDTVEDCVKLISQKANDAGIKIFTEFSDTLPPLFADQRAFKQILLNLLSNSLDFTPERGEIKISADFVKEAHFLTVSDTGSGIPSDEIPFILKPFKTAQLNPHNSRVGTGLGLAITNSLIKLHGGELDINSSLGKGTVVTIKIPKN